MTNSKEKSINNNSIKSILGENILLTTFYFGSVIFFPLFVILIGGESLSRLLLSTVVAFNFFVAIYVILSFLMLVGDQLESNKINIGSIFKNYFITMLPALFMLKLYGYAIVNLIPKTHEGILCDLVKFVKDLLFITRYDTTITYLIVLSLTGVLFLGGYKLVKNS